MEENRITNIALFQATKERGKGRREKNYGAL